jgi:hypothetical protein
VVKVLRKWRLDVSLVCFVLVLAAAIPVALLRTKTYSLGYDLGRLKSQERELRQRNVELLSQLASTQRAVRDKYVAHEGSLSGPARGAKIARGELVLPEAAEVLHGKEPHGKAR